MPPLADALLRENERIISIVGAGGKTSLMFALAHASKDQGCKVISTTTTRILRPDSSQSPAILLRSDTSFFNRLNTLLKQYTHLSVADHISPDGSKLIGLDSNAVTEILDNSAVDRLIIEADGARGLSLKAAGAREPVVPQRTDLFICLVGLDIIGRPLTENAVFRPELVARRTGTPVGAPVTPETVAQLAVHPEGLLKGCPPGARSCVLLNKCDIAGGEELARQVVAAAAENPGTVQPDTWLAGSVQESVCVVLRKVGG